MLNKQRVKFNQEIKVQPLTAEEINLVNSANFIEEKRQLVLAKYKK